jgi:hypothetical protein
MRKKTTHYVNNKDFLAAIIRYKAAKLENLEPKRLDQDYIGKCLMLIANKLATKANFANYSYKDEMISDGIENCLMYFTNFDPNKSNNPFAYFTQIIHFSFIRRIQKEKKQQYVKMKNIQNFFLNNDLSSSEKELYDNNQEFILQFEKSLTDKKKKSKVTGLEKFLEEIENAT